MTGDILLVDDDPFVRMVIGENLSDAGFIVHGAADERHAFEQIARHPDIAVAIVDYCLPNPVGIELCRAIRAQAPDIALILFTAHDQLASARLGDEHIPVLPKTIQVERLADCVHALMDGRALELEDTSVSRAEQLWLRETRRETIKAVGKAMHNQFDDALRDPPTDSIRSALSALRHVERS